MKFTLTPLIKKEKDFHSPLLKTNAVSNVRDNDEKHKPLFVHPLSRSLMRINLVTLIIGLGLSQVNAHTYAQQITLKKQKASLDAILKKIEKQSGYTFFYKKNEINQIIDLSTEIKGIPLSQVLYVILGKANLSYDFFDKTVVVKKRTTTPPLHTMATMSTENIINPSIQQGIKGRVVDEQGNPVEGASIRQKHDEKRSVKTNANGVFNLPITALNEIIVISFVGYENQEIKATLSVSGMLIKLRKKDNAIEEVVVTGTGINRNKDSFTGTTTKFSGAELKAVSNNNIIQSLKTLDPSFLQIENNLAGSNPNVMPVIEVRGKSSIPSSTLTDQFGADPNQPLFVLDGFPTTIQTIVDLDMNRVASVTILKDAASTALYGSQASNGVVVIETVKPKPGELQFTYTQDFRFEMPDLSAYNMMNATEKLEFERLSGRYNSSVSPTHQIYLDSLYNQHLIFVKKGVNSYWLSEPLQNGFSTNNSINAAGGDETFIYNLGLNYRTGKGAMIGSGRDSYSGSINLTYRKNKVNINNITYIRGNKTTESQYGSFSTWVNTNPYYEKNWENPFLEISRKSNSSVDFYISNPLYDAMLPQYNKSKNLEIQNNFNANYDITSYLRANAALQMTKGTTEGKIYKSPEMSDFFETPTLRKGRYTDNQNNNFSYQGNLMLTFYKTFAQKHQLNANWRNTIAENKNDSYQTVAEGFPAGNTGNPRFAYNYLLEGAPLASSSTYRTVNTTLSANYSYDNRYLFDVVYRLDGSTAYGSNKQFSPYYAVGIGWNIHKEAFAKKMPWINSLRLTGNIGVTGNQNFANISSISLYNYTSTNYNQFGQGVTLNMLGNPNLEPQKTQQISTSLDFSLFNNRFTGYINAYNKKTDPLIVPVDLPSSTGVFSYPYNIGSLTYKGLETKLTIYPIYNLEKGITWNIGLTAASYKSQYGGFSDILRTLNKQQETSKSLIRYIDGNSAEAIWATKSLGIDPTTGKEVFLTKDGQYTFDYSAADVANVGNSAPKVEGVISTNLRIKGFTFGLGLRYRLGGDIFNTALFDKVENINFTNIVNNQDKRALYDRWQQPGDIAQFKAISQTTTTPISSRFVQSLNTLSSETLNIGYLFDKGPWLQSMKLKSLSVNLMANDFLYFSTVRRERGISYPYARTFAFSFRASF